MTPLELVHGSIAGMDVKVSADMVFAINRCFMQYQDLSCPSVDPEGFFSNPEVAARIPLAGRDCPGLTPLDQHRSKLHFGKCKGCNQLPFARLPVAHRLLGGGFPFLSSAAFCRRKPFEENFFGRVDRQWQDLGI